MSEAVAPVSKKPTEFRFSGGGSLLPEAVTRAATHASAASDVPGAAALAADGEAHDDTEEDAADASAHSEDARPIGKLGTFRGGYLSESCFCFVFLTNLHFPASQMCIVASLRKATKLWFQTSRR